MEKDSRTLVGQLCTTLLLCCRRRLVGKARKLVKGKQSHRNLSACKGRQPSKETHAPEKPNGGLKVCATRVDDAQSGQSRRWEKHTDQGRASQAARPAAQLELLGPESSSAGGIRKAEGKQQRSMLDDGGSDVPLGCVSVSSVVGKRENGEASHQKLARRRGEANARPKPRRGWVRSAGSDPLSSF